MANKTPLTSIDGDTTGPSPLKQLLAEFTNAGDEEQSVSEILAAVPEKFRLKEIEDEVKSPPPEWHIR